MACAEYATDRIPHASGTEAGGTVAIGPDEGITHNLSHCTRWYTRPSPGTLHRLREVGLQSPIRMEYAGDMTRTLRNLALGLTLVFGAGCYGQFALTKKVHAWNGKVTDNKFVHSLLFWGMIIVPVYEVATFVDAVFFNVVEFWTGANLLDNPGALQVSAMADGSMVFATAEHRYRLYPLHEDGVRIFVDGKYAGRAERTPTGAIAIENESLGQTMVIAAQDVLRISEMAQRPTL